MCAARAAAALVAAVVSATASVVRGQSEEPPSVRDGIFSAAQVERGRESFEWECRECHEMEEFTGAGAYLDQMEGKPLWDVFEYIWSEMPEDMPAWLEPEEYAAILSYVLSVYGMPAGASELPIDQDSLEKITVLGPSLPGS